MSEQNKTNNNNNNNNDIISNLSNRIETIESHLKKESLTNRIKKLENRANTDELEKKINNIKKEKRYKFWIPIIVSFLAIAVSIFSIFNEHMIATKSGEFDKGNAIFGLGNFELDKTKESVIIIVNEIEDVDVLLLGIPFSIYNSGNLNLESCNLTISYPNANGKIAVNTENFIRNKTPINLTRNFYEDDLKDFIRYEIPKIQPKEPISFTELNVFRNSSIMSKIKVKDKDSVPLNIEYRVEISYESKVTLSSDDIPSSTYNITYHHFNLENWKKIKESEFLQEYLKDENIDVYVLQEANSQKEELENIGSITISDFKVNMIGKFD